jgi:hypothetical protein
MVAMLAMLATNHTKRKRYLNSLLGALNPMFGKPAPNAKGLYLYELSDAVVLHACYHTKPQLFSYRT